MHAKFYADLYHKCRLPPVHPPCFQEVLDNSTRVIVMDP